MSPWVRGQAPIAPSDQFTAPAPIMTFMDMNTGQPWGRYVVSETVTVPKYEYREFKERVLVPTWVQEPRATTATQYEQVVSYQLRPRSVPSWNPFTPPQQVLEYVPIVQYQPRNVQAMQMTTYQKYEEREITRMVPVMVNASEQRGKFVDRPLTSPPSAGPMASNLVQESAMVAQASRTSARFPTRSIDYPSSPYGSPSYAYHSPTIAWNAPQTLVPSPATTVGSSGVPATPVSYTYAASSPSTSAATSSATAPPSSIVVGNGVTYSTALVPVPSAWVASNPTIVPPTVNATATGGSPAMGVPANPYPPYAYQPPPAQTNPFAANPYAPNPYWGNPYWGNPYAANPYAANPYGMNPYAGAPYGMPPSSNSPYSWMYSTGTLYSANLFQTRPPSSMPATSSAAVPSTQAYASNAPNFWGRTAPTTMPPTWGTYPPIVTASGPPPGYR